MAHWIGPVAFVAFACAGYIATEFAEWLVGRLVRSGAEAKPPVAQAIRIALAVGTGFVGAVYVGRGTVPLGIAVILLACLTLDVGCCTDLRLGRLPVYVTAPALALAAFVTLLGGGWIPLVATFAIVLPFACAAFFSRGRNLGWTDVQLIAVGALVLNPLLGIMTLAGTCFLAAGVALARRRAADPIVFAPYLAATIQLALLSPGAVR